MIAPPRASESLCGMGASNTPPTNSPWVAWHFKGTVVSSSPGLMVVRVEWQRLWDKGAKSEVAKGIQRITLRNGERIELGRVLPGGFSPCGAVDARLEAAVVTKPVYRVAV